MNQRYKFLIKFRYHDLGWNATGRKEGRKDGEMEDREREREGGGVKRL